MGTAKNEVRYFLRDDVAWREVDGEYHLLTADSTYHFIPAGVGSFIFSRIAAGRGTKVSDLVRAIKREFDVGDADVLEDVRSFLEDLVRKGIVEEKVASSGRRS